MSRMQCESFNTINLHKLFNVIITINCDSPNNYVRCYYEPVQTANVSFFVNTSFHPEQ